MATSTTSNVIQETHNFVPLSSGPRRWAEDVELHQQLEIPLHSFKVIPTHCGATARAYNIYEYDNKNTKKRAETTGTRTVVVDKIQWVTQCYTRDVPSEKQSQTFPFMRQAICTYEIVGFNAHNPNDIYRLTFFYLHPEQHHQISRATVHAYNYAVLRKVIGLKLLVQPFFHTPVLTNFYPDPVINKIFTEERDKMLAGGSPAPPVPTTSSLDSPCPSYPSSYPSSPSCPAAAPQSQPVSTGSEIEAQTSHTGTD